MTEPNVVPEFIQRVLVCCSRDDADLVWDEKLNFYVKCGDIFEFNYFDSVKVTPENIHILEKSIEDSEDHGGYLFCARIKGVRPRKECYEFIPEEEWPLFNQL